MGARIDDVVRVVASAGLAGAAAAARRLVGRRVRPAWGPATEVLILYVRGAFSVLSAIGPVRFRPIYEVAASLLGTGGLEQRRVRIPTPGQPLEAVWSEAPDADGPVLLYFHGGGYLFGSARTHASHVSALARAARARALSLDYRLAPEHPMPAALEDALAAYRHLLAEGIAPERIVLAGDSSGGHLVIATLLALRDAGDPLPAAGVGISPGTEYPGSAESFRTNAPYDYLPEDALHMVAALVMPGETARYSWLLADLTGLPPLLLQAGEAEIVRDQVCAFAARAEAAGVDVRLSVYPDMVHVWHGLRGFLPEAQRAIDEIGAYVRQRAVGAEAPARVEVA